MDLGWKPLPEFPGEANTKNEGVLAPDLAVALASSVVLALVPLRNARSVLVADPVRRSVLVLVLVADLAVERSVPAAYLAVGSVLALAADLAMGRSIPTRSVLALVVAAERPGTVWSNIK